MRWISLPVQAKACRVPWDFCFSCGCQDPPGCWRKRWDQEPSLAQPASARTPTSKPLSMQAPKLTVQECILNRSATPQPYIRLCESLAWNARWEPAGLVLLLNLQWNPERSSREMTSDLKKPIQNQEPSDKFSRLLRAEHGGQDRTLQAARGILMLFSQCGESRDVGRRLNSAFVAHCMLALWDSGG